jgi:DNA-binding transcriptional regulator YiaG
MKRIDREAIGKDGLCPECNSAVETRLLEDRFQYGSGAKAVELQALVPIHVCPNCGFEYTDFQAEDLRHAAVCRHLGVMTPAEVAGIRKPYDLSRTEFARRSHIGEASLARWEAGELIQTQANDNYMYLLSFPENMQRVQERFAKASKTDSEKKSLKESAKEKFRAIVGTVLITKQEEAFGFRL